MAKRIRQGDDSTRLILGGASCPALDIEELLRAAPFFDGVVLGEGEEPLVKLLQGEDQAQVPGLCWRNGTDIVRNRRVRFCAIEEASEPDFSQLDLWRYLNPSPVLGVLASRGCRWARCRFCAHNSSYTGRYRPLSAPRVADQLARLQRRYGVDHFYFTDLYLDSERLESLSGALLERSLQLSFHVLGRPTPDLDRELLERASRAGLSWISWGVESGSQRLLDVAGKGTTVRDVERVIREACEVGISNLIMMIFGLPTSSDSCLEETFDFLERSYAHFEAMTATPFALFRNSPFGRRPERFGLHPLAAQIEVEIAGLPVHSRRLEFREVATDGSLRPPRNQLELGLWTQRRRWLGEAPFLEGVNCEHYLLFVSKNRSLGLCPSRNEAA